MSQTATKPHDEDADKVLDLLDGASYAIHQAQPAYSEGLLRATRAFEHCGENRKLRAAVHLTCATCFENMGQYAEAWCAYLAAKDLDPVHWTVEAEDALQHCDEKLSESRNSRT